MAAWLDLFFLVYFILLNGNYAFLISLSMVEVARRNAYRIPEQERRLLKDPHTPPITLLAPAYNEEATIIDSVDNFLRQRYPDLRIMVINDGSEDDTMLKLITQYKLEPINRIIRQQIATAPVKTIFQSMVDPRLWVIDKEHSGKADSLNVGINACQTPLVCSVDSDTLLDRQALLRMVDQFILDPETVAVGGAIYIANSCKLEDGHCEAVGLPGSWLARFQIVEYLRAFLYGRIGYNPLGGSMIISGAFGLFSKEALLESGGYFSDTVGEDMEMVVRLHKNMRKNKKPYKIKYVPDPISYTEVPEDVGTLGRQRDRWQRGLADSLLRHPAFFFNPKYGWSGIYTYPSLLLFELLGPVIEVLGYAWFAYSLIFRNIDPTVAVMILAAAFFFTSILSLQSLVLDAIFGNVYQGAGVRFKLFLVALLENFGYRQITLFYRLKGMFRYFTGERAWGEMKRKGFSHDTQGQETQVEQPSRS